MRQTCVTLTHPRTHRIPRIFFTCADLAHSSGTSWCGLAKSPSSGDHFRLVVKPPRVRQHRDAALFPNITLGKLVAKINVSLPHRRIFFTAARNSSGKNFYETDWVTLSLSFIHSLTVATPSECLNNTVRQYTQLENAAVVRKRTTALHAECSHNPLSKCVS